MRDYIFNEHDIEAAKKLDAFLPDRLYDAHMHISLYPFYKKDYFGFNEYHEDMAPLLCGREVRCHALATPTDELKTKEGQTADLKFFCEQLDAYPQNTAAVLIKPEESYDEIESHIAHKNIKGFKCYHIYAKRPDTFNAELDEYLPEAAWEVASKHHMCITLHMVKDKALSDPDNLNYIRKMAKRYPDATLILAHAARSFAAWTGIEAVEKIADLENVYFDFSAVCESPAMQQIVKKAGVSRCLWGSDYPVCRGRGKAISLADSFYWIYENDLNAFSSKTTLNHWLIALENLYAVKEMATLADLSRSDVEDIFFNNAMRLWFK